ncbi:MAG: hypothetical protein SFV81_24670 [Pirellulaceae bacterium]|nr:hypothetical protein [Pirellulaceae bacterium]
MITATLPLTVDEVRQLAADWYRKLDVHAPLADVLPLLAEEHCEMVFPEATLSGLGDFERWYEGVIRIFFDEVHTLKDVTVDITEDGAKVQVVVYWEASAWNAPAAKSKRIKLYAYQTWFVQRSHLTGKPVIAKYTVDKLEYCADSALL